MTIKQLLKMVIKSHPNNIWLIFVGYITDNNFIIRDKKLADKLIEEYILQEYKKLQKIDSENKLIEYNDYLEKRLENLSKIYNNIITSNNIEYLFDNYEKYKSDNIEISEFIESDLYGEKMTYIKLGANQYYTLSLKYIDIMKQFGSLWKSNYLISKPFSDDFTKVSPIWIHNPDTGYLYGLIMPIKNFISDYDYLEILKSKK